MLSDDHIERMYQIFLAEVFWRDLVIRKVDDETIKAAFTHLRGEAEAEVRRLISRKPSLCFDNAIISEALKTASLRVDSYLKLNRV